MPFVNVKLIEGVFTPGQKQQIIRDLTEAMVAIEGENLRPVTWVVVEEVHSGDWGVAGNPLSTAEVKALAAGPDLIEAAPAAEGTEQLEGVSAEFCGRRPAALPDHGQRLSASPSGGENHSGTSGRPHHTLGICAGISHLFARAANAAGAGDRADCRRHGIRLRSPVWVA
jgi:4-oxalocrotonate tautomerase